MNLNEVLTCAREGRLIQKSEAELRLMLITCGGHLGQSSDTWTASQIPHAISAIREELASRQLAKEHQESIAEQQRLHQIQIAEAKRLSDASDDKLKSSIDGLRKPHWTLTPSFAVIVLTMVFAAIAAWPVIREWFPTSQPTNKTASFPQPQSNSMPVSITKTQALPVAPIVLQSTNHLAK